MSYIVVSALEMETEAGVGGYPLIHTGVGKVNAAIALMEYISNSTVDRVINFGTAGSRSTPVGQLVKCTKFIQRDMDKTALGFKRGETAYESDIPMMLEFGEGKVCGTGDNFVQDVSAELDIIDIFDMEAYALAKVCFIEGINFVSYKYVSDNANDNAPSDWEKNLADGIILFEQELDNIKEEMV